MSCPSSFIDIADIHSSMECIQRWRQAIEDSNIMKVIVSTLQDILKNQLGAPEPYPEADHVLLFLGSLIFFGVGYYIFWGRRHSVRRWKLAKELNEARRRVEILEEKVIQAEIQEKDYLKEKNLSEEKNEKPIRIWMDGCFDMMHYGHMNAFRQGKALGTYLIVGVNNDETIIQCKGPPVMNDEERITAVQGVRFVDEVVTGVPYIMNEEYIMKIMEEYKIDYIVHGDDPCIVDGKDVYEIPKKMGKYKTIPRTEGISTTDIVGRMLLMTTSHHRTSSRESNNDLELASYTPRNSSYEDEEKDHDKLGPIETSFFRKSKFLTTSRMIRLFSVGMNPPQKGQRIIYMDGAWDMFHYGHVKTLEKVKKEHGDYLIVGVHNDHIVNNLKGSNHPILNMNERVLSVLGCKHVDDVLIDAPFLITTEMIASLKIDVVLHGCKPGFKPFDSSKKVNEMDSSNESNSNEYNSSEYPLNGVNGEDRYDIPKKMGIYKEVESPYDQSVRKLIRRIQKNQEHYSSKFAKKKLAEDEYYANRYNLELENGKHAKK